MAKIIQPPQQPVRVHSNPRFRIKISAFIEGVSKIAPAPFMSLGGKILLCKLTNGREIALKTSYNSKTQVVVSFVKNDKQILAEVYSFGCWRAGGSKKQIFLIKDGSQIFDGKLSPLGSETEQVIKAKRSAPSDVTRTREIGAYIVAWWKGEVDKNPDPQDKTILGSGHFHLCSFDGTPVKVSIGIKHRGQTARISYDKDENSRWFTVVGENFRKEFWLIKDGVTCSHPRPKSAEPQ